jgi:hypothetical protein
MVTEQHIFYTDRLLLGHETLVDVAPRQRDDLTHIGRAWHERLERVPGIAAVFYRNFREVAIVKRQWAQWQDIHPLIETILSA